MIPESPLLFEPVAMERVWGGRGFETSLGKKIPLGSIGELWEMVDRPEAQSFVQNGHLQGITLHDLWQNQREFIFGSLHSGNPSDRFPLLIKLLDAKERLSVQVHPPASKAEELKGEPKTECWYFLNATDEAVIYAGLKNGVTRKAFEKSLQEKNVEEMLHCLPARKGESIFIPSGRLHAIGGGLIIVEIQQNSDTTYRVFDWNRTGLDGKPRILHLQESLASIDFEDFQPELTPASASLIADCPYFHVEKRTLDIPLNVGRQNDFSIVTCLSGELKCLGINLKSGGSMLVPSVLINPTLVPKDAETSVLITTLPAFSTSVRTHPK
ncbi:MAG: type I phosphomannose isomerase catalytic subunit [Verrucomicrobiota bacterium]